MSDPSALERVTKGRAAEERAAAHLYRIGYTLVTRRYKGRRGEVDIVCLDGETLVFVEVRANWAEGYIPEESIGAAKLSALQRAASEYRAKMEVKRDYRFDIIAIDRKGLRHHKDIFRDR